MMLRKPWTKDNHKKLRTWSTFMENLRQHRETEKNAAHFDSDREMCCLIHSFLFYRD